MALFLARSQFARATRHHYRFSSRLFSTAPEMSIPMFGDPNQYLNREEERNEKQRKVQQLAKNALFLSCKSTAKGGVCDIYVLGVMYHYPPVAVRGHFIWFIFCHSICLPLLYLYLYMFWLQSHAYQFKHFKQQWVIWIHKYCFISLFNSILFNIAILIHVFRDHGLITLFQFMQVLFLQVPEGKSSIAIFDRHIEFEVF